MDGIAEGHSPEYYGATGKDSRLLGDDAFVESVLRQAEQRKASVVPAAKLLETVCNIYDLTGSEITDGSRLASEIRSMTAWIAKKTAVYTLAELAKATGRDPSSLSSATNRIEARARK
jgi:chromosomal replication initiation ATPase DnaA